MEQPKVTDNPTQSPTRGEKKRKPKPIHPWKQFFMRPAVRWAWFIPGAFFNLIVVMLFLGILFFDESGFFVKFVPLPLHVREFITGPVLTVGMVWYFIATGVRIAPKYPIPIAVVMEIVLLAPLFGLQALRNLPLSMPLEALFYHVLGFALGLWSARNKHLRLIREREDAEASEAVGAYAGAYPRNLEVPTNHAPPGDKEP